ncbi:MULTISPECIES: HNH endonuclease signature motif containing protein [unclassified Rhodococcus (in: high G+C Gram-positive bacteria)]|uniref:HNH endonuclease signature motif containing protein n=1 Tax=unclassified Rhodococcus (in: high G+C Gram-positive bacteria) TaxID=192944 RepID=UPI00163A2A63|nr:MULTISPECIES: HNH endonuclease signature motif containing protein [unclassified Rhodococcus (in: high G+C Gram-positive bacteria)]MBC2639711.1 DUF222 domain-containing protein [Rhodococcus sp. 3A]MBC2895544.1 DUF222 domain-containing protein [Rhodococcus sp. 4CII]
MFDTGVFDQRVRETACCLTDTETDVGLVELMTDLHRSESVVAERKLAVIAELFVRRTAEIESDGAWTSTAHEVVEAEIGAALTMGRAAAGRLIGLGMSLRTRLPATREAMARCDLDLYRVRLIEDATANVTDDCIGEVEHQLLEQVLAPQRSADVEPVRLPSVTAATTYRPDAVLDTWLRVLAGGCEWLHCDVAAWNTDLDHHRPFDHSDPAAGGPTVAGNLNAYCRNHHRLKHSGHWQMDAEGGIELTAPTGHRYRPRSSGLLGGRPDGVAGGGHLADRGVGRRTREQNTAARIRAERRRRQAHLDAVRHGSRGARPPETRAPDDPAPF